jgi:hypothetical protein
MHHSQYQWIAESEIATKDVKQLTDLYRKHIENKMTIIPGLQKVHNHMIQCWIRCYDVKITRSRRVRSDD